MQVFPPQPGNRLGFLFICIGLALQINHLVFAMISSRICRKLFFVVFSIRQPLVSYYGFGDLLLKLGSVICYQFS